MRDKGREGEREEKKAVLTTILKGILPFLSEQES